MTTEWKDLPTLQDVAQAQAQWWEIEFHYRGEYCYWDGVNWNKAYMFRGRPRQPKMKKLKMLCWYDCGSLLWFSATNTVPKEWVRVQSEDKEIEIPE